MQSRDVQCTYSGRLPPTKYMTSNDVFVFFEWVLLSLSNQNSLVARGDGGGGLRERVGPFKSLQPKVFGGKGRDGGWRKGCCKEIIFLSFFLSEICCEGSKRDERRDVGSLSWVVCVGG